MSSNILVAGNNASESFYWLLDASEIKPESSAILSQNYFAFYTIHYTAIVLIVTSLVSCVFVIISIFSGAKKHNLDFSDRFPLYVAIGDFLWGVSHFIDHLILITRTIYPSSRVVTLLGVNLFFFLG